MPARSEAQQALFGMALAVRRGEMKRAEASKEVLNIVDSDMTNKEIEDFASTSHKGLADHVKESISKDASLNATKRVFVVIKPEFLIHSNDIIKMFQDEGFRVIAQKMKKLTLKEAHKLYKVHKNEDFFDKLCEYMSSGPSLGIELYYEKNYYNVFRVVDEIKEKARKLYGIDDMKNAIHGSDSEENMKRESKIYF